jgi:phosphatidylserine/phosphatidylglycerophosphate/cardiolipin synthase-like enzyme
VTETEGVSPAIELIFVILLPTAVGYAVLGSFRACRWAAERHSRKHPSALPAMAEPIERLAGRMRRLRAELEATETRSDLPAKGMRLRAIRGAYLDLMRVACERLDVAAPPPGDLVPQADIYRTEATLRRRGLDVRETASR